MGKTYRYGKPPGTTHLTGPREPTGRQIRHIIYKLKQRLPRARTGTKERNIRNQIAFWNAFLKK